MTARDRRCGYSLPIAGAILVAAAAAPTSTAPRAQGFEQAEIFLELNDTDGDLGLHATIDGGPWTSLEIQTPDKNNLLSIMSRGVLAKQGLTQLSFESAEPTFAELPVAEFLARFPEGIYGIEARAQDGATIAGKWRLSHILAAPPRNITVNGQPAPKNCDARPLPAVTAPVVVDWDPVTTSHPKIGTAGPIKISRYQVFIEGDGFNLGFDLPPEVTDLDVPKQATATGAHFKLEIIARTVTGNNTATETCFRVR
jgi:hypothetical protein